MSELLARHLEYLKFILTAQIAFLCGLLAPEVDVRAGSLRRQLIAPNDVHLLDILVRRNTQEDHVNR